jgi:hypothetical protein
MTRLACGLWLAGLFPVAASGCSSGRASVPAAPSTNDSHAPFSGDDGSTALPGTVSDAGGSPNLCSDLFDQTVLQTYSFEISPDNWAKLDADFHDLADVLAGTPPQTFYPVTFHFGSETVTDAAVRLRGKSSWVNTVMFDASPKMQFVIAFDQVDPKGKFHGVSKIHFEMPRDDWTFMNDRIGNNWLRKIGQAAPCANNAKMIVNGAYYGLYVAEETVNMDVLKQFFPTNNSGDLFKGGFEPQTNLNTANWGKLNQLQNANDLATLQGLVDLPSTVAEWAAEATIEDADGYYGGSHNYYVYDQGAAGYVWLADHTDSALEWSEMFTPLAYKEHPIYWWVGRPLPDPPGKDYLIVLNDPTWRGHYVDAIATQVAKWDVNEILGWIDAWSPQIADAVTADPRKWATADNVQGALAGLRDMVKNRPKYLQSFVGCERGDPASATDGDGDGVPWCNDCDDGNPSVHPGAAEVCGNKIDDNCNGIVDEGCP